MVAKAFVCYVSSCAAEPQQAVSLGALAIENPAPCLTNFRLELDLCHGPDPLLASA